MTSSLSSLFVGERLVSRCDDGLLEAEYSLFDRSEVMLSAATGQGVREGGYMTTAGFARARLNAALVTADLAYEAFSALRARSLTPLARSSAVVDLLDRIGPHEAFEGGEFVASRGRYRGVWLDLDSLAAACPMRDAAMLIQALHLLLVLEEVAEDAPVRLLTGRDGEGEGLAGERTWRRIPLEGAQRLPWVLREIQSVGARTDRSSPDEAEVREVILRNLKTRATDSVVAQPRLLELAAALARTGRGSSPAPAEPSARGPATERMSSRPPRPSVLPPRVVTSRPPPGPRVAPTVRLEELRGHTARLRGDDRLREVAVSLSALAGAAGAGADLKMLAARAWLAAGEAGHARHFARDVAEDPGIGDDVRVAALEILDATPKTHDSTMPPPMNPIQPAPVIVLEAQPRPPPGASMPPMAPETPAPDTQPDPPSLVAPAIYRPEIVETLPLPPGLTDAVVVAGAVPATPDEARVTMIRLARQLARDYRMAYGTTLKTDVVAIDAMQRHLRRRLSDGPIDDKHAHQLEVELTRHGALLSEILARRLGACWVDVSGGEPGRWAMLVPPGVRVWPIGRVYRFFGKGYREADLVAFYSELDAGARG